MLRVLPNIAPVKPIVSPPAKRVMPQAQALRFGSDMPKPPGGPQRPDPEEMLDALEAAEGEDGDAYSSREQESFHYRLETATHPFTEYHKEDAKRITETFERQFTNHVILETDDDNLRNGTMSALTKAVYPNPVVMVAFTAMNKYKEVERPLLEIAATITDAMKERNNGELPGGIVINLVDADIRAQERLTNPQNFEMVRRMFPYVRFVLTVDPRKDGEAEDKMSAAQALREYLKDQSGRHYSRRVRSNNAQQGNFRLIRPTPLKAKDWVKVARSEDQFIDLFEGWNLRVDERQLERVVRAAEKHKGKLNQDVLLSTLDSLGQFVNDNNKGRSADSKTVQVVDAARITKFIKHVLADGVENRRSGETSEVMNAVKAFKLDKENPFTHQRPLAVAHLKNILLHRQKIRHAFIASDSKELGNGVLELLRKQLSATIPMYRLDVEKIKRVPDWDKELPLVAERLQKRHPGRQPIVLALDNIGFYEKSRLTSTDFDKIQRLAPRLRLVAVSPEKLQDERRNRFAQLFGFPETAETSSWFQGRFETIKLDKLKVDDWKVWIQGNKGARQHLAKSRMVIQPDAAVTMLGYMQRHSGEATVLTEEVVLAELDSLTAYMRGKHPIGKVNIDKKAVGRYIQEVALPRERTIKQKTSGLNAPPFRVLRPGEISTTFDHVIGNEHAKGIFRQALDYMQFPKFYEAVNAGVKNASQRLVLLEGNPGNGKNPFGRISGRDGERQIRSCFRIRVCPDVCRNGTG